jgi:membrane fusion protein (multidrug efflux system)
MTKRRAMTVLAVLAVAAAAALILIKSLGHKTGEEEVVTDVAVHVGKITRATLRSYVTAYGTVEPEPPSDGRPAAGADLSFPVGGILTEIRCTEGQRVERGAILFRLDTRLAEVSVTQAQKALDSADKTYERQKKLLAADGTSQKTFQEATLQLQTARSDLAAAQTALSYLEIKAPLAGTVVRISAHIGQTVEPNVVLAQVIAFDRLVLTAQVPSHEASLLKAGRAVDFGPGSPASGKLVLVGKDIDPKTDTVLVRASLPAGEGFRPGQFVSVRIVSEEHRDVLAVPEESVVPGPNGGTVLMVVEDGKAVPTPVKAGLRDGGLAEVEGEGLKEGLVIVTADAYNITGETKIHIVGNK